MALVLAFVILLVAGGGVVVGAGAATRRPGLGRAGFVGMGVGMGILVLFVGLVVFGMIFND